MTKTVHWEDTTRYAVMETATGRHPVVISGGSVSVVLLDCVESEAEVAIDELVAAGSPILRSNEELLALARASRGRAVRELAGSSEMGLWQDQWGTIWLKASGHDPVAGAVQLSKYEALGLAEQLLALSDRIPERPSCGSTTRSGDDPRELRRCDECGSDYFADSSQMAKLCPECAHLLYGHPPCAHSFDHRRCTACGWDGSRSDYLRSRLNPDAS